MPPPRSIPCEICGKGFFKSSYPIHLKQCQLKKATSYSKCKKCNLPVSNDEYSEHFLQCKQKQKAKPVTRQKNDKKQKKTVQVNIKEREVDDLGRISCQVCKRGFSMDRISKHEMICLEIASKKKRKQYPSTSKMRIKGTMFEAYQKQIKKKKQKQKKRNWKLEHAELKKGVEQGLLIEEFKRLGLPLSKLPTNLEGSLMSGDKQTGIMKMALKKVLQRKKKSGFHEVKKSLFYKTGDEVLFSNRNGRGTVKYIGRVPGLHNGFWLGVEVQSEFKGNNDGGFKNMQHFECKKGKGIFIRPSKAIKVEKLLNRASRPESKVEEEVVHFPQTARNLSARLRNEVKTSKKCFQSQGHNLSSENDSNQVNAY